MYINCQSLDLVSLTLVLLKRSRNGRQSCALQFAGPRHKTCAFGLILCLHHALYLFTLRNRALSSGQPSNLLNKCLGNVRTLLDKDFGVGEIE